MPAAETAADVIRRVAVDAPGGVPPREMLSELIGDARIVLIGESSHGTQEFYEARAEITKWLIDEKGFCAVAAEADWPDAYRVNRYVRGIGDDANAEQALRGFERFPSWMWRNTVVRDFVDWLRNHNQLSDAHPGRQTGFYGLDLYSLHRSMQEVVSFLDRVDPMAAARARSRYSCFDHVSSADDGQAYGFRAAFGAGLSCEGKPSTSWSTSSEMRWPTRAATGCWPRMSCSTPNRTHTSCATPSVITGPCSVGG